VIIFGFRKTRKILGTIGSHECSNCHNISNWDVVRLISWFTLFFIPIIPYRWQYFEICPICEHGREIKGEEKEELRNIIRK